MPAISIYVDDETYNALKKMGNASKVVRNALGKSINEKNIGLALLLNEKVTSKSSKDSAQVIREWRNKRR